MTKWLRFGLYLGISLEEMEKSTKSSIRKDIIHRWLEMGREFCSWQKLIDALVGANEVEIAKKIAAKYGKISVQCIMTYVFHFADVKVPKKAPVLSTMIQKQSKVVEFGVKFF